MNKYVKWSLYIFCGLVFLAGCNEFIRRKVGGFAGSYPFVESWVIDAKESLVIEAIKELQKTDKNFTIPYEEVKALKRDTSFNWDSEEMKKYIEIVEKDSLAPLPKQTSENSNISYWLFIDFYYVDTKQYVSAWTRPAYDSLKTDLALVSISKPHDRSDKMLINRDFWYFDNKREIKKFEKLIVDKIRSKVASIRQRKK